MKSGSTRKSGWRNFFEKPRKKCLTISGVRANISKSSRARHNIRVWRSLVSRLNGVQEAAGSNPVTRTRKKRLAMQASFFNAINPCGSAKCAIAYEVADAMKFAVANEGFISLHSEATSCPQDTSYCDSNTSSEFKEVYHVQNHRSEGNHSSHGL